MQRDRRRAAAAAARGWGPRARCFFLSFCPAGPPRLASRPFASRRVASTPLHSTQPYPFGVAVRP
eukprot:scaffold232_cov374-Prasinococcus_capsulatus_cf.AAC.1